MDRSCIACVSCITVAPKFFQMKNNNEYSIVVRQPESEQEIADCEQAIMLCPVGAIGNNGLDEGGNL